jgi:hypothetical protein
MIKGAAATAGLGSAIKLTTFTGDKKKDKKKSGK